MALRTKTHVQCEMWGELGLASFLKSQWTVYSQGSWACDHQGTGFSDSNLSPDSASSPNTPTLPSVSVPHVEIFLKNWEADC